MYDTTPPSVLTFDFRGIKIHYEMHGTGLHALVLLHGFGASIETWRDIGPLLSRHYKIYLLDLKGCGLSDKPHDGAYAPQDQGAVVSAFLETIGEPKVTLVGHSYGGAVALLVVFSLLKEAVRQKIKSLVLIDAAVYKQPLPFHVAVLRIPFINKFILKYTTPYWRVKLVLNAAFWNRKLINRDRIERHAKSLDSPGSHGALIQTAQQILSIDLKAFARHIRNIDLRTLIIWGKKDRIIPVRQALRLHKDILKSELIMLDNCGHVPHEELPQETAAYILRFLGKDGSRNAEGHSNQN